MKQVHSSILLLFSLALSGAALADEPGDYIRCEIEGITNVFTVNPTAVLTQNDGLHVFAFTDFKAEAAMLELRIPSPRLGPANLQTITNMTLVYSRSTFSSSTADYFAAQFSIKDTAIQLILKELAETGRSVHGAFSGVAANAAGRRVFISNGTFRIIRSVPITKSTPQKRTQPAARANSE